MSNVHNMQDYDKRNPLYRLSERAKMVGHILAPGVLATPLPTARGGVMVYRNGKEYCTFLDVAHAVEFVRHVREAHHPLLHDSHWSTNPLDYLMLRAGQMVLPTMPGGLDGT